MIHFLPFSFLNSSCHDSTLNNEAKTKNDNVLARILWVKNSKSKSESEGVKSPLFTFHEKWTEMRTWRTRVGARRLKDSRSARLACSLSVSDRSLSHPETNWAECQPDEIEYLTPSPKAPERAISGGAGTYAALGARLSAGPSHAQSVSFIVDMGHDFPDSIHAQLDSWNTNCIFRLDKSRLTTAAWNGYGENEFRQFKYITPKKRLEVEDLDERQVNARAFHMVCSPARAKVLVEGVERRRVESSHTWHRNGGAVDEDDIGDVDEHDPIFVWEPVPDLCTPEELARMKETASLVDVLSPNAEEFAAFFEGMPGLDTRQEQVKWLFSTGTNGSEKEKNEMSSDGTKTKKRQRKRKQLILVIREGAHGCTTYTDSNDTKGFHLPAYHTTASRVLDPTGGGNTFLGALAIALTGVTTPSPTSASQRFRKPLSRSHAQLVLALVHATVAASYAIEQVGMPSVSATDGDVWNGEKYTARFEKYLEREGVYIEQQVVEER